MKLKRKQRQATRRIPRQLSLRGKNGFDALAKSIISRSTTALHLTRRKRLIFYISRSPSTRVELTALGLHVAVLFNNRVRVRERASERLSLVPAILLVRPSTVVVSFIRKYQTHYRQRSSCPLIPQGKLNDCARGKEGKESCLRASKCIGGRSSLRPDDFG